MEIKNFKTLPSTNQKAKELALKGASAWMIVLAKKQTAGYGRKGMAWFSPLGGLYFSIILPRSKIEDLQTLTILAAFIVTKTIKETSAQNNFVRGRAHKICAPNFSLEPLIKLPNDVLLNGKKVCGILTENVIGKEVKTSVMGIGLNTNIDKFPKDLENIATSLKIELGKEVDNEKILKQILKGIKEQLKTISE